MPYDEGLAHRLRELLDGRPDLVEKKMFGGIAFLVQGNMTIGVVKEDLVVRVGPERFADEVRRPGARIMDFTGKPMAGWIMVSPAGYESDADLEHWVQRSLAFALSLPAKA